VGRAGIGEWWGYVGLGLGGCGGLWDVAVRQIGVLSHGGWGKDVIKVGVAWSFSVLG
jgi:hypothetical protein